MILTRSLCACGVLLSLGASPASAIVVYDANVTPDAIFGGGNANGSYTVDRTNGIELGLRGKLRHNASGQAENTFNSNGNGTYSFAAGAAPTQSSSTAVWSFEWSINSDFDGTSGFDLADLNYELGLDTDPGAGTTYGALVGGLANAFDPIHDVNPGTGTVCWDHSIGTNATGNGGGTEASCPGGEATYAGLIAGNNVAQQSWKPHWFISGFDPGVDGQYDLYLAAFDGQGNRLARTDISIIVGAGAAPVNAPATAALMLLGVAAVRRRRDRAGADGRRVLRQRD